MKIEPLLTITYGGKTERIDEEKEQKKEAKEKLVPKHFLKFMSFLYILKSTKFNRNYTGATDNIEKRLKSHNDGKVKSTKAWRPWVMAHMEEYATLGEAKKREWFLKCTPQGGKEKKKILENAGIPARRA